jgi:hypothetical protein
MSAGTQSGNQSNQPNDPYNRGGMIAFVFSMVFVTVFFIYLVAIHPGIDLHENVRDIVKADQGVAKEPEFDPSKVTEPWISTPAFVAFGKKQFEANCAMCHGDKGMGDGAAGQALNPRPRNLVEGKWTQGLGSIAHFKVVTHGIPGSSMAPFGHLPVVTRWALVHFIDSITQNKSKDTPEELKAFGESAK